MASAAAAQDVEGQPKAKVFIAATARTMSACTAEAC
jgi:hypothetical protein